MVLEAAYLLYLPSPHVESLIGRLVLHWYRHSSGSEFTIIKKAAF